MASHKADTVKRTAASRGRLKVLFGIAALCVAVVLVMGGQGTFAFWTDQATVNAGGFSTGKLDLTVDGAQGTTASPYQKTTLALSSMVPGESVAQTIAVANAGDASFGWVPTVTTGGDLGSALQVDLYLGGTTAGQTTTYPRNGSCTGTRLAAGASTTLAKGATAQTLCVQVSLPSTVADSYQGKSTGTVSITLAAIQVLP